MAHTPGPWVVAGESGNTGEAFVIESDKRTVCWTADSTDEEWEEHGGALGTDEDRANARLIAAAPELLKAVKDLVFYFACTADSQDDEDRLEDARAVIAKAEGRGG